MARKPRREDRRPTDRDLQAYVDGELDPARRAEVREALRHDAELRAVVRRYQAQRRALRRLFDPVLAEPMPESLERVLLHPAKRRLH
jgi:anti-sigma factor RsiW